jgi:hypothetical protein
MGVVREVGPYCSHCGAYLPLRPHVSTCPMKTGQARPAAPRSRARLRLHRASMGLPLLQALLTKESDAMSGAQNDTQALRAAADSDNGLVRTVAGFGTPNLPAGTHIHYRTVSALVKRGLLEYAGRGRATITDSGRETLRRLETDR